jgi:acyl-CoA reductase-like NAD-dependent aldehyde dehydrogenase
MVSQSRSAQNFNFRLDGGDTKTKNSPLDGSSICEYVEPNLASIKDGIMHLRKNSWKAEQLGIVKRSEILQQFAQLIEENENRFVELVRLETGKPLTLGLAEVRTAVHYMRSIAGASTFNSGDLIPSSNHRKLVFYERRAYGVAGLIVSFNTPLPNFAWKFAPAWLAGNSIVLKPSEHNPLSATLFAKLCIESGVPIETFALLLGGGDVGDNLIKQDLDLLSFTGSLETGLKIQAKSSNFIRKTILELGGSNPIIIFPDSDLDAAVEAIVQSAYSNTGQRCASASRLLVHSEILKEVWSRLKKRIQNLIVGIEDDCEIGPLIDLKAVERYNAFLDKCREKSEVYIPESNLRGVSEYLVRPAMVILESNSELLDEELFAPVLRVIQFDSDDEALEIANATKFGLTAAVWTRSITRIELFKNSLKVGVVNFNGPTHGAEFQFPFGGMNQSGNGTKEVGLSSLDEYSFKRLVTIDFSKS